MNPDRWQQVERLYHGTLARPAEERAVFLAEACADDEPLRRDVQALLDSPVTAHGFLDAPALAMAARMVSDPAMSVLTGRRLGVYHLQDRIGAGGMGEVYRARDTKLGRDVAIKILPRAFTTDPDRLARFEREARMLAALNHPNIGAIYGFEDGPALGPAEAAHDGGAHVRALVLELVDGETLADRVRRGLVPVREALTIAAQIADALDAAHEKGIVHRDLKPANIKITPDGVVKVLDFGLAKAVVGGGSASDISQAPTAAVDGTLQGTILGTVAYMSPEQARGKAVDKRTDIWAFGCVLYEMLTGRAAFSGETLSDTIAAILDREPDWTALPEATTHGVRRLLRRCLEKDPRRRWRDAGDARIEFEDTLSAPPEPSARASLHAGRRRLLFWGVTGLAAAAVAVAYFAGRGDRDPLPSFRQLTFSHGSIRGAHFAPDGQTVLYGAAWTGTAPDVYLVRPESPESGSLGLGNAGIFSVSAQGEMAVALGCRLNWGECVGTLARTPMTGGVPREIMEDVQGADWSPDGSALAAVAFTGGKYRLYYPLGNAVYETAGWITSARVSPGGDRVAFLDHPTLGDRSGSVGIVDATGKKTTLSSGWKSLQGLAWSGSGDEIWFTGSRVSKGGSLALHAVTLTGRERQVFSSPGTLKLFDISPDGRGVLLMRGTPRASIVSLAPGATQERELSWFDQSTVADLSADGRTLLFYERGEGVEGTPTVYVRNTDGSDAVRLGEGIPLALSPDGRWALTVQQTEPPELLLLPTGPGEARRLPRGPVTEYLDWGAWSPNGRQIVFAAQESGDLRRTYVQDVSGGGPRPVTPDGFVGTLLSRDGTRIVAVDRYGEYYVCPVGAGEPRPLEGYVDGDVPLQWSADGRFLYVREAGNLALRIHTLDLDSGRRNLWKQFTPPDIAALVDIGSDPGQVRLTPDGTSHAYTFGTFAGELYLVQGLR